MSKLLHIQSSPRGERSSSNNVAGHFIAAYCASHPNDTVETLNVWEMALPEFDGETIAAKYAVMGGQTQTPEQVEAWDAIKAINDHFQSADKFVFSLPMWNFTVPYKLKQLFDVMIQPGLTFSFSPETGPVGLITGKPAVGIYARGFPFGPGSGNEKSDFQVPYLHQVLGYIGFTDIQDIIVEPTAMDADSKEKALGEGMTKAEQLARSF